VGRDLANLLWGFASLGVQISLPALDMYTVSTLTRFDLSLLLHPCREVAMARIYDGQSMPHQHIASADLHCGRVRLCVWIASD
jgi:hypothetical protein